MQIVAPTAGLHTITVTDQVNSVTSGAIPFTVASATHIPVLDARVQNPSQKFTDAQGVVWDIGLTAQCRANGVIDAITQQVDYMALMPGGQICQHGFGAWYGEFQNNDSFVAITNPLPAGLAVRCADVMANWGYQINIDQGTGFSNPTIIAASLNYLNSTLVRQQASPTHSANLAGLVTAVPGLRFMLTPMLGTSADFNGSGSGGPANNVTTNLNQALADIGGASKVFSIEGQNQANANQPSGTAASWAAGNVGMANAVRAISSLANVPILNLSLSNSSETAAETIATSMGNQTVNGISWNNWQSFPTDGTGGGSPFSTVIGQLTNNQGVAAPGRVLNWTAVGYDQTNNAANGSHVTGAAGGKMLLSGFMTAYAGGVAAVVVYQMFNDAANGFQLFDTAGNPNTMATYIHNFTTIWEDNGATASTFIPAPLGYTLAYSGSGTQASSLLMQSADGKFWLVLWNNDAVQTTGATPSNVTPAANNVTITLTVACTSGGIYDPTVGTSPASTFGAVTSIGPVAIQGYPKVVQIVP